MKEWLSGMAILVFIVVILLTAFIVGSTTLAGNHVNMVDTFATVAMLWVIGILFFPLAILLNSLSKEWKRPDVWLHSEGSIFKLFGSKFIFAGLAGAVSILIPVAALFIYLIASGSTIDALSTIERTLFIGLLFYSFYVISLIIACVGLLLGVLHQLIKPYLKGFSIPILVVFFLFSGWIVMQITASSVYEKIKGFGAFRYSSIEEIYIEKGNFFIGPTKPIFYTGDFLITLFSLVLLFVTATVLFEKKVRL